MCNGESEGIVVGDGGVAKGDGDDSGGDEEDEENERNCSPFEMHRATDGRQQIGRAHV